MKVKEFFKRKNVTLSPRIYFVKAMGSMAMGLFASLLIGTIFNTIGKYTGVEILTEIGSYATAASGAAIGIAIANALEAPVLVLLSSAAVGIAGYGIGGTFFINGAETAITAGPAGAFIAVLISVELGKLVSKETKVDILVTPTLTIISGVLIAKLVCPAVAFIMYYFGYFVNTATVLHPLLWE